MTATIQTEPDIQGQVRLLSPSQIFGTRELDACVRAYRIWSEGRTKVGQADIDGAEAV